MANAQVKANKNFKKENTKSFLLTLNTAYDADIIDALENAANKSGYIQNLIREDLERKGVSTLKALKYQKSAIQALSIKGYEFIGAEVCRSKETGQYFWHDGGKVISDLTEDEAWHRAFIRWHPSNRIYDHILSVFGKEDTREYHPDRPDVVTAMDTHELVRYDKDLPKYSICNPRRDVYFGRSDIGQSFFITEDGCWYTCDDDHGDIRITYPMPMHLTNDFGDEWKKVPSVFTK